LRPKHIIAFVLTLLVAAGCQRHPAWQSKPGQHAALHSQVIEKQVQTRFLLFIPKGYDETSQPWPLLIFIHGAGASGDNPDELRKAGLPFYLDKKPDFPFVVISPLIPHDPLYGLDALEALVEDATRQLRIDKNRIYLTGWSMGGSATWGWALARPHRFAAIAPLSASWDVTEDACALKDLPVWAFHGEHDDATPLESDQDMVASINKCGGDAKLTILPARGHDIWKDVYGDNTLFDWLLQHHR
jgi:predicted peptidase